MRFIRRSLYSSAAAVLFAALLLAVVLGSDASSFQKEARALTLTPLTIEIGGGRKLTFKVGIARSHEELERGLKHRFSLPADEGMLFDFGTETRVGMWMKNTYISLDMIFIDANGFIVEIVKSTTPLSEESIAPNVDVLAILEINGGLSDRMGIRTGDRVVHEVIVKALVQ